jgi:hypothetical protein
MQCTKPAYDNKTKAKEVFPIIDEPTREKRRQLPTT